MQFYIVCNAIQYKIVFNIVYTILFGVNPEDGYFILCCKYILCYKHLFTKDDFIVEASV